jgi:uncharacterized protein YdhG (YjbR/CyaY superfamily)
VSNPDPRVDAYLAPLPADQQQVLSKLRADIARLAPDAVETISYGMPAFKLDGKFLVSFAAWKRHCSIYAIDDPLLERHAASIEGYGRTKGALHFTKDQPLPGALLEDLIELRTGQIGGGRKY